MLLVESSYYMGRSPPDLSFEDYQPQYSRGGTEDPSSRIPPSHDNFIKLSMNATEWNFPVAWATDWVSQQILEIINGLTSADIYSPCKKPPTLGVESGRIPNSAFFASSFVEGREPYTARLNGRYAWRPAYMDADQYLYVDLGSRYYVTSVATQGRRAAKEYVTIFNLMYSDNGHNWFYYTTEDKIIVNFVGNKNDDTIVHNNLSDPVITRYIRFNPRQWNNFISMRVEVYGCPFTSSSFNFDGQTIAYYDATFIPLHNKQDELRLRFKTNYPHGLLFYAKGTQNNDFLSVELRNGSIFIGIDLGSIPERSGATIIQTGSVLDDYQWHDLAIIRYMKNISVKIDQTIVRKESQSPFNGLDLDGKLYVGGAPNHMERGINVRPNFQGCLENVLYVSPSTNSILDILQNLQRQNPFYGLEQGRVGSGAMCEDDSMNMHPYTFKTFDSYLEIFRKPGSTSIDISFQMRTFEPNGILFYTNLSEPRHLMVGINDVPDQDFLRLFLDEGQLACTLQLDGNKRTVRHRRDNLNDGQWHEISLLLTQYRFNITVDYEPELSFTRNNLSTTDRFTFSSNGDQINRETTMNGFVGCIRQLVMSGIQILPRDLTSNLTILRSGDNRPRTGTVINHGVLVDACEMFDRCTPNPCRHGGICHQTWTRFRCDCSKTGYSGAVCHISDNPLSCLDYKLNRMKIDEIIPERLTIIDIDGSGPLSPFPVVCRYGGKSEILNVTEIGHYHELESYVSSGYQLPNSIYSQTINYRVPLAQVFAIIDRSYVCKQYIEYTCFNSRLLNYPNSPFGWWIGRTNQTMDYWGGSELGTGKCSCGLDMTCANPNLFCNCDSQFTTELKDTGYLTRKEFLPVLRVEFGDTGPAGSSQYGRYQVGRLQCEGDLLYDNTITFRKADAIITVSPFEAKVAGDIRFQFKTGFDSATFGSAIIVQNIGYDDGDLIEIRLQAPREIAFRYSVGRGTNIVTIRSPYDFNDNEWHTVQVEINRQEARLTVDSLSAANPEDQTTFRHIRLTSNLTIGASVTNRNGFVGCIRAFQVNGELIDLKSQALRGMYGISPGCIGKCQSNPCLNGGRCNERWSTYDCDCTFTPFRGPICSTEIGTRLEANTMIKYTFPTEGVTATEEETIRVLFTTYKKQGILMQLKSDKTDEKGMVDYFTLEMNNNGGVRVKFNYGFDTFEYNVPYDLTNGQDHEIIVTRRDYGKRIIISVDNYEPYIDVFPQTQQIDMQFDSPRVMYIGRNETTPPEQGFSGCIARLQFNRIFPLKYAFLEERDPNITWTGGNIREWPCGTEPVKYPPEPVEIPPDRGFSILVLPRPVYAPNVFARNVGIIVGMASFAVIFIAIGLGLCHHKSRKSGHYKTKEDEGADQAIDADTAIIRGDPRHPDLTEAKECIPKMVSLLENIDTINDDNADDSDAPIEVKTKTSKVEKKKKKNKTKRRIQYTLATEEDNDPNDKRLDEESALTHIVFGDDDDYLDELTSKTTTDKQTTKIKTTKVTVESKKPAWIDSEEVTEEIVREPNFNQILPRKRRKITTGEYETKLKFEYERVMGRPSWAEKLLNKKTDAGNRSDDSDEELFRRTGNYLTKSTVLRAGTIDCLRCADFKHDVAHSKLLRSVEFHPTARILLTAGRSQYLNLYQVDGKKNERIHSLFFERFSIDTAHFSRDGNQVIVTGDRNFFKVYDMIEGKIMQIPMMRGFEERLGKFELSPDGSLIVFINRNGQLHFVSTKSKELIDSTQLSGNINSVTFRHDSELMFASGDEGIVTVFDMRRRAAIHRFVDDGSYSTTSMCISPNQQYFITGQKSGIVNVYSYDDVFKNRDPKPIKYLKNLTTPIQNVKINSSSELLAINSYHLSRAVRLVHMPTLTVYENFPEFHDKKIQIVNSLDFSPNSGFLTLGNNNGKVLLYRLKHYSTY